MTDEKLKKNAKKYLNAGKEYGALNDGLIEFLGADIVSAPATPSSEMFNSFDGGLIDHMLNVSKHIVNINEQLPDIIKQDKNQLVKVALMHQIGKTFLYEPQNNQWRRENLGENYTYNNDLTEMKVGERSAYYAMSHGVELTQEEYQAVINFDKDFDKQAKYFTENIGKLLKQANDIAIMEEKEKAIIKEKEEGND